MTEVRHRPRHQRLRYIVVACVAKTLGVQHVISPTVSNWLAFDVATPIRQFVYWRVLRRDCSIRVTW